MAQISRLPLPKALEQQMYELFYKSLADLNSGHDIESFLDDLLTPTEKVMLAKRLAIAFLLDKGYNQRTVHTMMKVSLTTVNSINYWLKNKGDGYRKVIAMVRKAEKWQQFITRLDNLLYEHFSYKAMRRRVHSMPDPENY